MCYYYIKIPIITSKKDKICVLTEKVNVQTYKNRHFVSNNVTDTTF